MERYWVLIHQNYVVNRVTTDGEEYINNDPNLLVIEDPENIIYIDDWYESIEGIFYRPLKLPPDYPKDWPDYT